MNWKSQHFLVDVQFFIGFSIHGFLQTLVFQTPDILYYVYHNIKFISVGRSQ
jgi:hypothetical protein